MIEMNRREAIKTGLSLLGVAGIIPAIETRKPIAYIVTADSPMENGNVNRAWHVYWAHFPDADKKADPSIWHWCKNVKKEVFYDVEDFPERVKLTVNLKCPLKTKSIRDYDQFHCFWTIFKGE